MLRACALAASTWPIGSAGVTTAEADVRGAAVAAPATLTVMNPIHVAGTLIISYTDERDQQPLFRRLLALSVGITCVAPGLAAIVPALLV